MSARAILAALALALAGCAGPQPAASPPVEFLLLGEVHDNPVQHQLRAERLAALLADGRPTAVVFEQMPAARNDALQAQARQTPRDVEALVAAGQLDQRAWRWPLHRPLLEASVAGGARVLGGNLEREALRRVMRDGDAAWPPAALALAQRTPWGEPQQQAQLKAIDEGHCGLLPAAMHAPMARAQRARDAVMAETMLAARAAGAARVVLIAGNGHVERDLGVPRYLEAAGVAPQRIHAVGYLEAGQPGSGRYDERVDTVAATREDPCKALQR
ncbi:MAG: ChaN family lipoprotein [Roseateles sp.]|uniref:ChaN family lipoprotein n=1 Tax=Roseateles sp. TaxID=1971397 RepID=UPI0039E76E47